VTPADIAKRLSVLVGLPLWGISRACTLQSFQFGPRKVVKRSTGSLAGTEKEVGSHALHVQCAWRIRGSAALVVGSRDRYEIVDGGDDWDRPGANRCDVRVKDFVAKFCPCVVRSLHADAVGSLTLELEHGCMLDIFTDDSSSEEQWRFFSPHEPTAHAVFRNGCLRNE
jgi:hypothetical protein